jgi:hypothetical protein
MHCRSSCSPSVFARGAAKHLSEIVAQTGNNHKMIGALGHAKTLPGIIMGCETVAVDVNGRLFTLGVPDESVSELVTPL